MTADVKELESVKTAFDYYRSTDDVRDGIIMKPQTWFKQWKNFFNPNPQNGEMNDV